MPELIFMTGATGHTGSRVATRLVERGYALRCLVHTREHARYLPPEAEIVEGDVANADQLAQYLRGANACIHLAHIRYVHHIVAACQSAGVARMLCMSSTRRFSKFACDTQRQVIAGETAVENSSLDYTILRPSMIYGGDRDNNIEKLLRYFRKRGIFPLVNGGRQLVQPVFVRDVVDAILTALQNPNAIRKSYTIAGPEPLTYRDMLTAVARAAGREPLFIPIPYSTLAAAAWTADKLLPKSPFTHEQAKRLREDKAFDISPARNDLGFRPISFAEGIALKISGKA